MLDPEVRRKMLIASGIGLIMIVISFVLLMQQGSNLISWILVIAAFGCVWYSRRLRKGM